MKKRKLIVLLVLITLAISLTGCNMISLTGCNIVRDELKKAGLGERYDSDKIFVSEEGSIGHTDRLAELFDKYGKAASETEFVVHENTAIAIAEAVMKELYPDDNYGVVYLPTYFRPFYYKAENCWEVWLHRNALNTGRISTSDPKTDKVMLVYVEVNTGAVKAIIPADEF
jgi:predicted small secreted protein